MHSAIWRNIQAIFISLKALYLKFRRKLVILVFEYIAVLIQTHLHIDLCSGCPALWCYIAVNLFFCLLQLEFDLGKV